MVARAVAASGAGEALEARGGGNRIEVLQRRTRAVTTESSMRFALAASLLVALSGSQAQDPAAPPHDASTSIFDILADTPLNPDVPVLEPGKGRPSVLRYHPKSGLHVTLETTSSFEGHVTASLADGTPIPIPRNPPEVPRVTRTRYTAGGAAADGTISVRIEFLGATFPSALPTSTKETNAEVVLKGLSADVTIDGDGRYVGIASEDTPEGDLAVTLRRKLHTIADDLTQIPKDSVAEGARWQSTTKVPVGRGNMTILEAARLIRLESTSFDTTQTYDVAVDPNALDLGQVVPGPQGTITSFACRGTGTFHTDLQTLARTGESSLEIDVVALIPMEKAPNNPMTMTMKFFGKEQVRKVE
jgi:hypothetical protein